MFGEYAQIATYVQSPQESFKQNDPYSSERMPPYLRPSVLPPQPWSGKKEKSGLGEDFIMIAEFSELEGPKPVLTIPKDGGSSFDQNTFSVKILAVDHQHSSEGFTITEDAQVVYSDLELGVFAFVHHLVLFDNTARGFVRPYCIAYITSQQRKIMSFYEEISWQMKKAARYLKYGNRMVFVGDLERHLKDLEHTKGFLLNQVSKIRLKDSDGGDGGQDIRKNAEAELYKGLQTIRQSNMEIKEILSILKPLLSDRRLEARFKVLEEKAFQNPAPLGADNLSLQENWYNDLSTLNGLDTRCGSLTEPRLSPLTLFKPKEYKPHLVETKKAKRFNSALRGLHELCSWGAKEGLKKLRSFHEYCKRDIMLLIIERNESLMKYPSFSTVCHAECMTGNFLSGMYMNGPEVASDYFLEDWSGMSREILRSGGSIGSFDSLESFKSADSKSLSLAMQEGSPTSIRTADSLAYNKFESAQSSPKGADFSLLMENEYYSDMDMSQNDDVTERVEFNQGSCSSDSSQQSEASAQHTSYSLERKLDSRDGSNRKLLKSDHFSNALKASKHSNKSLSSLGKNSSINDMQTPGSWPLTYKSKTRSEMIKDSKFMSISQIHGKTLPSKSKLVNETRRQEFPPSSSKAIKDLPHTVGETIIPESKTSNVPESKETDDAKPAFVGDEIFSNKYDETGKKQEENQECLSKLLAEDSIESINLSSDTFRASPFRPHAPFPGFEDSTEEHTSMNGAKEINELNADFEKENFASDESRLTASDIGLTHQLASLHATKVRADSEVSSVFTEVSTRELYPHLIGPEVLSSSYKYSSSSHNDGLDDDYVDIPAVVCDAWKPKCGLMSVGDWINNLGHSRPGYCLMEVLTTYHNMQHVIASLLTGRPVLIAGSAKFEGEVGRLVTALSIFVGSVRRKRQHAVLEWTSKPPRVPDLTRLRLVGVCRPDRRLLESFIPAAVRQTCTVIDVEKKIIIAPPYQGQFVTSLLSKRKVFKTDAQLLAYIQWWLMDIMSKTFIFYHSFCMGSSGSIIYSQSAKDQRDSYCGAVSAIMTKLGVKESDCDILEHLTELAKLSQIEQKSGSLGLSTGFGMMPIPLHLHHKVCQTFRC